MDWCPVQVPPPTPSALHPKSLGWALAPHDPTWDKRLLKLVGWHLLVKLCLFAISAVDHIFEKVNPEMESLGLECTCLGGGKIEHNSKEKKLRVFGASTGYGKADHSVTAEKLKQTFEDYEVTWSDDKK
uniref:Si:dkey-51e6.1 n=1 Tax=Scleropages formosus TaxID=113540 RepID=A0A8C9R0T5_SCLFO